MKKYLIFALTLALLASGCGSTTDDLASEAASPTPNAAYEYFFSYSEKYRLYAESAISFVDAYFDNAFSVEEAYEAMETLMKYGEILPEPATILEDDIKTFVFACYADISALKMKLSVDINTITGKTDRYLLENRNLIAKTIGKDERKSEDTFK